MKVGAIVRLRGYGGEELRRRLVAEDERHVAVCREEEYQAAQRERREPKAVNFLKEFVLQ